MPTPEHAVSQQGLSVLRSRIDAIDAEIHRLLIDRSDIIDLLIAVKRTDEPGAAFRPGREAAMMHALVDRHRGHLPIVTVEHLWREIISTFTWLQAPYTVHVATGRSGASTKGSRPITRGAPSPAPSPVHQGASVSPRRTTARSEVDRATAAMASAGASAVSKGTVKPK